MQTREVRILFTTRGGQGKYSSVDTIHIYTIQIDFLIDGDNALENVKKIIYEKFNEEYWKDVSEEHKLPVEGFRILAWSAFETENTPVSIMALDQKFAPIPNLLGP